MTEEKGDSELPDVTPLSLNIGQAQGGSDASDTTPDGPPLAPPSLTPQSPSSGFSKSRLSSGGGQVTAILLSQWDNILGPRVRHLWTTPESDLVTLDMLNQVSSRTLSGEICRDPATSLVDMRFYVMREYDLAVTSFVFGAMGKGDLAVHSLSLFVPQAMMSAFLNTHSLCQTWITRIIGKLRVLLDRGPAELAMAIVGDYLSDLMDALESLQYEGLPPNIWMSVMDTYLSPAHVIDEMFLRKAISSHLMTCGHTVVVGNTANPVNLMIITLALFLSPRERLCSRIVREDKKRQYHPGICLQGSLKENGQTNTSIKDILFSEYPTTLVDLVSQEVRQSQLSHKHLLRRHEMLQEELTCLWRNQEETNVYPTRNIFLNFDDSETLVKNFLEEITLLPETGGVRENYVDQFMKSLHHKALALIKYIEPDLNAAKVSLRRSDKKIRTDLGLATTGDYKIVLAMAERLKPGIGAFLCSDPKQDTDQMSNILETF